MFEGLHHGERDLAMRAGIALAVRRLLDNGSGFDQAALGDFAHELVGVPAGLFSSSPSRWAQYAAAVQANLRRGGATTVNAHWGSYYTGPVADAARTVADIIVGAVESRQRTTTVQKGDERDDAVRSAGDDAGATHRQSGHPHLPQPLRPSGRGAPLSTLLPPPVVRYLRELADQQREAGR